MSYNQLTSDVQPNPPDNFNETGGFNLNVIILGLSFLAIIASAGFYFAGGKYVAIGIIGLWVLLVIIVSPRAGVVLTLSIQIWDIAFNPETGGGYDWISPGRVLSILVILSYLRYILSTSTNIRGCKYPLLLFFLFILWGAPSVLWAYYKKQVVWSLLKIIVQLAVTIVGIHLLSSPKVLRQTLILMAFGSATGALYVLLSGIAIYSSGETRLALGGVGINSLATSLGVSIVGAVALMLLKKNLIYWLFAGFCILAMMLVALRTGTRSVLLGVPLAMMFGFALGYWRHLHKLLFWGVLVALLSFGTLYWSISKGFVTGQLRDRLLSSFEVQTYKENPRLELWAAALKIYVKNPMGTGPGNEKHAFEELSLYSEALESHNVFLSILVQYNIIGLCIFIGAILLLLISICRIKNPVWRCVAGMFWAICMLSSIKGTLQETRLFWQPIMLIMIIIEIDYRCKKSSAMNEQSQIELELNSAQTGGNSV